MGHAKIQTTMGYSSHVAEHLRSLVDDEPAATRSPSGGPRNCGLTTTIGTPLWLMHGVRHLGSIELAPRSESVQTPLRI
jgi:hypothetical protein